MAELKLNSSVSSLNDAASRYKASKAHTTNTASQTASSATYQKDMDSLCKQFDDIEVFFKNYTAKDLIELQSLTVQEVVEFLSPFSPELNLGIITKQEIDGKIVFQLTEQHIEKDLLISN